MTTQKINVDCIEMTDRSALRIHEELKEKSKEETLEYWRRKNELFRARYPRLKVLKKEESQIAG